MADILLAVIFGMAIGNLIVSLLFNHLVEGRARYLWPILSLLAVISIYLTIRAYLINLA